ncbi:serine hydrolase domain-containing protein [Nocardioides pelophilus]|uniref:serine hydrolase domain-containing protein n=1 Tax=Nocardioides pelophilus TaxID=2172019 RepID=UPI0015FFF039|nr:serine hydrolase domain-containing protein [Nocardioides pelophilus]
MEIRGHVSDGFDRVAEEFEENFASRGDVGAGLAVMVGTDLVVDLYGGVTEPGGAPYTDATLQMVASVTKGAMAICVLRLVDQGKVDLDAPLASYWPEFGAAGKERVTVREALAHRAGVPYLDGGLTVEDLVAWHPAAAKLAAQEPAWEPATAHGYHAITHAWLVGELIRRVTGQLPGDFLATEVCSPLGLDLYVGLPTAEHHRVSPLILPVPRAEPDEFSVRMLTAGTLAFRSFFVGDGLLGWLNLPELWSSQVPSGNGMGTARAVARMYAATTGEVDGIRLVSPETLADAVRPQSEGPDLVTGYETRYASGFQLSFPFRPMSGAGAFGHYGLGGSVGFADRERGFSFGYTVNQMGPATPADARSVALIDAVVDCLG